MPRGGPRNLDEQRPRGAAQQSKPRPQATHGAVVGVGGVENGFVLHRAVLVGLAFGQVHQQGPLGEFELLEVQVHELRAPESAREAQQQQRPVPDPGRRVQVDAADGSFELFHREGRRLVLALAQGAGNAFHDDVKRIERRRQAVPRELVGFADGGQVALDGRQRVRPGERLLALLFRSTAAGRWLGFGGGQVGDVFGERVHVRRHSAQAVLLAKGDVAFQVRRVRPFRVGRTLQAGFQKARDLGRSPRQLRAHSVVEVRRRDERQVFGHRSGRRSHSAERLRQARRPTCYLRSRNR